MYLSRSTLQTLKSMIQYPRGQVANESENFSRFFASMCPKEPVDRAWNKHHANDFTDKYTNTVLQPSRVSVKREMKQKRHIKEHDKMRSHYATIT